MLINLTGKALRILNDHMPTRTYPSQGHARPDILFTDNGARPDGLLSQRATALFGVIGLPLLADMRDGDFYAVPFETLSLLRAMHDERLSRCCTPYGEHQGTFSFLLQA